MTHFIHLLAVRDVPLATRFIVLLVAGAFGALAIFVGRFNVRSKSAESTGTPGLTLLRGSSKFEGKGAVNVGQLRILAGILAIVFGVIYFFFANQLQRMGS